MHTHSAYCTVPPAVTYIFYIIIRIYFLLDAPANLLLCSHFSTTTMTGRAIRMMTSTPTTTPSNSAKKVHTPSSTFPFSLTCGFVPHADQHSDKDSYDNDDEDRHGNKDSASKVHRFCRVEGEMCRRTLVM